MTDGKKVQEPRGEATLREISTQPETLAVCMGKNKAQLHTLASLLREKKFRQVLITARGTSYNAAVFLQHLFLLHAHIPVSFLPPSIFTVYAKTGARANAAGTAGTTGESGFAFKDSLFIAVSQSGKGKDIVEVTRQAKEGGALTLALTNEPENQLAQTAEHVLLTELGEQKSYTATKTYTATLYLAYRLVSLLTERSTLTDTEVRAALTLGLSQREQVQHLVPALRETTSAFLLGRGATLSLALELALKLKETAYFNASGFSYAEFYHGPVAAVSADTPVIMFGLDAVTNADLTAMAEKVGKIARYTLMITNDAALKNCASETLFIDEPDDEKAFFAAAILLQLYTYELAMLRGNNPDYAPILDDIDTF